MTTSEPRSARPFLIVMFAWLAIAVAAGASGRAAALHPPVPQIMIVALTAALVVAGVAHKGLRQWVAQVNLRWVVAFHITRFVGAAFLVLYARGELPREFAVPGGWGDIAVASLALLILIALPRPESQPRLIRMWNVLGMADILAVVYTGARLGLANPASMSALLRFPVSLVPTFIVPLVIASHVLVFWRLQQLAAAQRPAA